MKRPVMILIQACALIGGAFCASVLAAPPAKPAGNDVLMESSSGAIEFTDTGGYVVEPVIYPTVAHVSLTIRVERDLGSEPEPVVAIAYPFPDGSGGFSADLVTLEYADLPVTLRFDTEVWDVRIPPESTNSGQITLHYNWTATYPNPK